MKISDVFRRLKAPQTGRPAVQLTSGDSRNYPLYYFIPSFSKDGRYLIHHRVDTSGVQLFRLDLQSGEDTQVTNGTAANTHWYPWCVPKGPGVLDHRSVLNVEKNTVIWFNDREVIETRIDDLRSRPLFTLPADRLAIGQNCVTTDGKWFVYIHHDRAVFEEKIMKLPYQEGRNSSRHTALCAFHLESGEMRDLLFMNSPIHHVLPLDHERVVFCHPVNENGMLLTDIHGHWYSHLRTQDSRGGQVCHYVATRRGLMYEVLGANTREVFVGMYQHRTNRHYEFALPQNFGYTHTGCDPEGRLWFYENELNNEKKENIHDMHFLERHDPRGGDVWKKLCGNWTCYGGGQSAHFHPRLSPDRKWILMTAGDPSSKTNHLFLLDVRDLKDTAGIPKL